jgi:NAD(P)-dependent dehydrogenase (short-subunit alcohol dehydrogenase family)
MIVAEHPIGRRGTADDIVKAILYFASDDSSWTTGAVLALEGEPLLNKPQTIQINTSVLHFPL